MKKKNLFSITAVLTFLILIAGMIIISCSKTEPQGADLASCGTCNWYGTTYPVCCSTTSGWGWENNASCIAAATCTGSGQTCTSCSSSSSSSSSGGCTATAIVPYIQVNGAAWVQTASATVASGATVIFGPQPASGGSWSWSGLGTSGTVRQVTIHPTASGVATATYTNSCGTKSTQNFTITVSGSSSSSSSSSSSGGSTGGFKVSGTSLKDANGNTFTLKGLAVPLAWFVSNVNSSIATIKSKTNANALRIVVTTATSDANWQACVQNCINNKMIPIVELHDVTCGTGGSQPNTMAQWWAARASYFNSAAIKKYILINICNEWGDWAMSNTNQVAWSNAYKPAITTLRNAGINTTLIIDAPGCGQDIRNGETLRNYASGLESYDPQHNILFSVHFYGEWASGSSNIATGLPMIKNAGIPIIVGEFSYENNTTTVLNTCASAGVGYMAWSWYGNSNPSNDMTYDWAGTTWTSWANTCVNGSNGLKTATNCSVF